MTEMRRLTCLGVDESVRNPGGVEIDRRVGTKVRPTGQARATRNKSGKSDKKQKCGRRVSRCRLRHIGRQRRHGRPPVATVDGCRQNNQIAAGARTACLDGLSQESGRFPLLVSR